MSYNYITPIDGARHMLSSITARRRAAAALIAAAIAVVAAWWLWTAGPVSSQAAVGLCESEGTSQFSDVTAGDYAADYILCAKALGLTEGKTDGTYDPSGDLTRGQIATFLTRLWTDILHNTCPANSKRHPFTDIARSVHKNSIACIWALEVTTGTTETTYSPYADVNTSQITRFIARMLNQAKSGTCNLTGNELNRAASCLTSLNIAPNTTEAKIHAPASRAQMAVYLIGAWHDITDRGRPPKPPARPSDTTAPGQNTTTTIPSARALSVISSRGEMTCVITGAGDPVCWGGSNYYGQSDAPARKFSDISSGSNYACGILVNGDVECWGSNRSGQTDSPAGKFTDIAAGGGFACAITTAGAVTCWGDDIVGQVSGAPSSGKFKTISAHKGHACAIADNGDAVCWGDNWIKKTDVPAGKYQAISAGDEHTCAITDNGDAVCWGMDSNNRTSAPSGKFKAIAAGTFQTCAITTADDAVCWGGSTSGEANAPTGKFSAISAGFYYSCAVSVNGGARCWGSSLYGRTDVPSEIRAS